MKRTSNSECELNSEPEIFNLKLTLLIMRNKLYLHNQHLLNKRIKSAKNEIKDKGFIVTFNLINVKWILQILHLALQFIPTPQHQPLLQQLKLPVRLPVLFFFPDSSIKTLIYMDCDK